MAQVNLHEFDTYAPVLLDTRGPLNPQAIRRHSERNVKAQGFFSVRKLGLIPPRVRDLVAVFLDENSFWMVIKNQLYNLSIDGMTAMRRRHFPGAQEFVLMKGAEVLVSCTYWNTAGSSVEGSDIFEFVEQVTKDEESKVNYKRIWSAYLSGQNFGDMHVLKEMESTIRNKDE